MYYPQNYSQRLPQVPRRVVEAASTSSSGVICIWEAARMLTVRVISSTLISGLIYCFFILLVFYLLLYVYDLENHLFTIHDINATLGHGLYATTAEVEDSLCLLHVELYLFNHGGTLDKAHADSLCP